MKKVLLLLFISLTFVGCSKKKLNYAKTFPSAVEIVADQLSKEMRGYGDYKIVFTSLVDLNNFKESSNFGRLFSESLMTQLKIRGNQVIEYRGDGIVTKTQKGEFKLNRGRTQTLEKEKILVLVGTYSKMDDSVIVNVRIVERESNKLASAASVYIPLKSSKQPKLIKTKDSFRIQLVPSECSKNEYCWREIDE